MAMSLLTHKEIEERLGFKLGAKVVMCLLPGNELWHREANGEWERYPPYPSDLEPKLACP